MGLDIIWVAIFYTTCVDHNVFKACDHKGQKVLLPSSCPPPHFLSTEARQLHLGKIVLHNRKDKIYFIKFELHLWSSNSFAAFYISFFWKVPKKINWKLSFCTKIIFIYKVDNGEIRTINCLQVKIYSVTFLE